MRGWRESPRYQRAIQRLARMSPEQKAIFSTMSVDKAFAGEEMSRKVKSMQMAADKETRASRLKLGKRSLGLKERAFKFAKGQLPISTAIGVAGVATSGYLGYQKMKVDTGRAEELKRLRGLYRT